MSSPPRSPDRPTWRSDSRAHHSPPQTPVRPPRLEPPSLRASRIHERLRHMEQTNMRDLEHRATQEKQLRLFRMKRQKKREIWQFVRLVAKDTFDHVPDDQLSNAHAKSAYCLKCDVFLEFKQGKHAVKQHMDVYHPEDLVAFAEKMTTSSNATPLARNITKELAEVASRDITSDQQKHMNKLLAKWVACHYCPMVLVEDAGFIEFVRFITEDLGNVKVNLPKRTQLRHEIEVLAADLRKKVKQDISGCCKYYSITTDIWSSRNARSYISLTIHYVSDDFYPRNWTLEVIELPGIHDGEAIARALSKMMEDWSLMREYCIRMLSDSGANVVKAARLLQLDHMACIAHSLHLIVGGAMIKTKSKTNQDETLWLREVNAESDVPILEHEEDEHLSNNDREGMESFREFAINDINSYLDSTISSLQRNEMDAVRVIVQHFRTLAVYFRKSPKARNRLSEIQVRDYHVGRNETVNLQVDCPTRWSSCWTMLRRLLHLKDALTSFFSHIHTFEGQQEFKDMRLKLREPSASDWLAIQCLTTLLSPFSTAIKALGGQKYPTVTLILPILTGMRRWLSRESLFEPHKAAAGSGDDVDNTILMMNECRDTMLDLFNKRFSELEKSDLTWITLLDPCMVKQMPHLSQANIPRACEDLVRAAIAMADAEHSTPFSRRPSVVESSNTTEFDLHSFLYGSQQCEAPPTDWIQQTEELKMYMADAKRSATDKTSPFDWWRTRKTVYPNLSRLARKWLGVVATSVPSERAFSTSGNVVTVKRASLTPKMVRDIVFISENWNRYADQDRD